MKGFYSSDMMEKFSVFLERWLLKGGGRLQEVAAQGGSNVLG